MHMCIMYTYICDYACRCILVFLCTYMCMCVHVYVCMCVCRGDIVCICVLCTHTFVTMRAGVYWCSCVRTCVMCTWEHI